MTAELMTAIAVTPAAIFAGTALGLLWWASTRDRRTLAADSPRPELAPARLDLRDPCPLCGGRHCAGCDEPARHISTAVKHVARHDFSEVPPSLLWLAQQVDVTFRGALISSQLVGRHVWRPTDPVQFRLWASRKLGRPVQLGPRKVVRLP